jgi:hypothetical protein
VKKEKKNNFFLKIVLSGILVSFAVKVFAVDLEAREADLESQCLRR